MRSLLTKHARQEGFTLIEVLIIAPVVILAIGGFVALMIAMVADVLVTRDQNNMTFETQDAIDLIEQDTRLATQFLTTTKALPSPQGSDSNFTGTAAFTNNDNHTLIMGGLTTDKNPADTSRQIVYYAGQPYPCGAQQAYNRPLLSKVVYFLKDNSLWRRVVLPNNNTNAILDDNTVCSAPWQRNTCSPGYTDTRCQTNDAEIMQNVNNFSIKYFSDPAAASEVPSADALSATSIEVTLSGQKTTAGRSITNSGSLRATKLNNIDVEIPAPGMPAVSVQLNGNSAVFSWPKVPLASSYDISYNINGGTWNDTTLNSQTTSYTVNAPRGSTITIKVTARNSTGSSSPDTVTATIPEWYSCDLVSGWGDFNGGFATAAYTKTTADVVVLKGLIKDGTTTANTPICQLPAGYRPAKRMVFATSANTASSRVEITTDGYIRFGSGSNAWLSLEGIRFVASTASYTWSSPTLLAGWSDYNSDTFPHETAVDNQGRVHVRGVISPGTTTAGTAIFNFSGAETRWSQFTYLPSIGATGFNWNGYGGVIDARLNPGLWLSLNAMFYPGAASGWYNMTPTDYLKNGWVSYGVANHATPAFYKAADGIVTLKGLVKNANLSSNATVIGTLPPGFRPKQQLVTSCVANGGYCRIDIAANGDIIDTYSASNAWVSLDNISFMAEQ